MSSIHEANQFCFTKFGSIYNFLTFLGWVDGEIKIKDQLSPAEAEIGAELGNILLYLET